MVFLTAISALFFIISFARLIGSFLLRKNIIMETIIGLSILSYLLFALGIIGYLKALPIYIISIIFYILFLPKIIALFLSDIEKMKSYLLSLKRKEYLVFLLLIFYLLIGFLNCLTPPYSRDALNYHLYLPKIWLKEAKITYIKSNIYSFFPHLGEVIYLYCLIMANDITAKLIHYFFFLFSLGLIYLLTKHFTAKNLKLEPLLLMLIFVSSPMMTKYASWVYVDFLYCALILGAFYMLINYDLEKKNKQISISALMIGLALGTKYLALVWLILFLIFVFLKYGQKKAFFFMLISFSIASPWYLRNLFWSGNPFFPFLYQFFDGRFWDWERAHLYQKFLASYGLGTSFKDLLLFPWRVIIYGDYSPEGFDGKISFLYILLLSLLPFFLKKKQHLFKISLSFSAVYFLFWFYTSQQLRFLIPALALYTSSLIYLLLGLNHYPLVKKIIYKIVILSALFYLLYPLKQFIKLKPHFLITAKIEKEAFLRKKVPYYPVIEYINKNLPQYAKVMLIHIGAVAYYLERKFYQDSVFEEYTFAKFLKAGNFEKLLSFLHKEKITHLLLNEIALSKYLYPYLNSLRYKHYLKFRKEFLLPIWAYKGIVIYKLKI